MEKLTVSEVTDLLRAEGIPDSLLTVLAENHIDGIALGALPDDFEEFKHLIPSTGLRMRIKALIRNWHSSDGIHECSTSLGNTGELFSSSMAIVDGPVDFMGFTDPLITDPDPPFSSSYEPTPINVSTEAATPTNISTEEPVTKKPKVAKTKVTVVATGSRLPEQCPLPVISERTKEIISSGIKGNNRFFLLREAVTFYEGICPNPTSDEYVTIAKTLCHKYPELKDKDPIDNKYWESVRVYISQRYRNSRRYSAPKSSASVPDKKLVTASFASAVDPTSVNDMTAYERNTTVMLQLYERKSDSDYSHMIKLMKMTHEIRRSNINNSTSSAVTIKEEYPFFGHEKWVEAEFSLMCGDDAVKKICDNWNKYIPKILEHGGVKSEEINKVTMLKAIQIMDKSFRPLGVAGKSDAAFTIHEPGTNLQSIMGMKTFPEPRLLIFARESNMEGSKGLVVAEKQVLFEIDKFTITIGLTLLIAAYYVFYVKYPKSSPASSFLLFIQEHLLGIKDSSIKHSQKYRSFVSACT